MKLNLKSTIAAPASNNSCQKALNGIIGNTRRGIVVDKTLDPDSNNPVANKPVSTALAALAGKIDAALQKPTGLTKTKLVGVGASGQENIEIGDNLTLANGKISATGGGGDLPELILSVNDGSFIGDITNSKSGIYSVSFNMGSSIVKNMGICNIYDFPNGDTILKTVSGYISQPGLFMILNNDIENNINKINFNEPAILDGSYTLHPGSLLYFDDNYKMNFLDAPNESGKYLTYNVRTYTYEWSTPTTGGSGSVTITFED